VRFILNLRADPDLAIRVIEDLMAVAGGDKKQVLASLLSRQHPELSHHFIDLTVKITEETLDMARAAMFSGVTPILRGNTINKSELWRRAYSYLGLIETPNLQYQRNCIEVEEGRYVSGIKGDKITVDEVNDAIQAVLEADGLFKAVSKIIEKAGAKFRTTTDWVYGPGAEEK